MKTEGKSKEKLLEELKKLNQRISELEKCEIEHSQVEEMNSRLNCLKDEIIGTPSFNGKLKLITDDLVDIFDADFAGIWMIKEGDLCEEGCIHAEVTEGPHVCVDRAHCLHLMVSSSSQYPHINGYYQRVPFGCQRIGRVASSDPQFITNDVMRNPQIHDYEWAQKLGIVSFAGFRLLSQGGNPVGVMALFSHHKIGLEEEKLLKDLVNTTSNVIWAGISAEELIASEEKFRNIIEQSYDGFALFDEKGRITEWNPAQEHITGLKRKDVLGRFMWDVTFQLVLEEHKTPELHEIMKNGMSEICMTGKISGRTMGHEMKIKRLDGTCRIVEIVDFPIQTDNGFIGSSITRDVTERKQVELALSESEKNFRAIAENASEGILIGTGDKGIHVYANQMAAEITGYTKEELIKKSIADLAHPDELNKLIAIYKSRITGKTVPSTHETCIVNKNNELVPVEITGAKTVWKGQPADLVLIQDISQRKKAEKKLEQANIYNRNLIEVSLDPLVTIGPEGKINDVNKATEKVTGHSRKELIGSDFSDYFTEPDKARKGYEKVFKEGFVRDYPLEIQHKNGHITPVLYNASVYQDEANRVVGVFAAARDINALKKAEEKIQMLANVVESSDDAIISKSLEGRITSWNKGAELIYGYSAKEILGEDISILAPPQLKDEIKNLIENVKQGEHVLHYETTRVRKNGKEINVSLTLSPVFDSSGTLVGISTIARDITQRKIAEKKLEQANIYNRNLIEVSLDPLVTIGPEGKINDVNKATEKVTGHSREELIGSDFSDYFTEPDKARKGYETVFKEGFVRDYPLEIQHKNGHITPVLYNASVYQDETNGVVGVFAAARDITQLREAEEKLKSSQKRLKILFDYAPDSLFLLDMKGNLVDCNLAVKEILGYGKEELIGKNFAKVDIIPRRQIPKLAAKLAKIALGHHPIEPIELDFTRKDGKLITMEMTAYLVNIKGQKLLFAIGRDTTERKQMEEQISQSLEEKEMLLREIHHRVKNNLMVISSLLNLQSEYIKDEEALGIFKESQSRARSMAIIHERLYRSTDLKSIDFGDYIQTLAMELFRTYQGDPGLIKMNIDVENLEIDINTTVPLGLIVNELVSNCLKHAFPSGKKGDINIDFHKINDEYVLKVCDTGVGFPEDLDFKKTESLGLQLVTNLTGQIDGEIELDQSHGTEFTIKFKELEL